MTPEIEARIKAAAQSPDMTETVRRSSADNVAPIRPDLDPRAGPGQGMTAEQQLDRYFSKVIFDDSKRPLIAPRWRVRDAVEVGGLTFIGGQSTAGKSFVVMELARCLMTEDPFFGRKVDEPCGVVLFAPEGQTTIDARLAAMKRHHRITEDMPFAYLGELPSIETPEGRALIVALLRRIDAAFRDRFGVALGAVFMDTLAATFQLKDQNDNSEAAQRIAQLREIQRGVNPNVTLLPVHHYGKTIETGLTGGHGWKAGADQVLSVIADKDDVTGECKSRELAVAKNRNGPEGPLSPFTLEYMGLGYREDGSEWGSLYLVPMPDQRSAYAVKKAPKVAKPVRVLDEAITEAIIKSGETFRVAGGQGPIVTAARLSPTVRELFYAKYATGGDDPSRSAEDNQKTELATKKKAFQRAMDLMPAKFATETVDGIEWVWSILPERLGGEGDKRDKGDK